MPCERSSYVDSLGRRSVDCESCSFTVGLFLGNLG